jgi:Uma2 family endonuclease
MTPDQLASPTTIAASEGIATPPLEQGDRLSRAEFERRYRAMPQIKKAELIEGVVFMPSPVRLKRHAGPHSDVIGWLAVYKADTPGIELADNGTARLDLDNEPQPDAMLLIDPQCGGQSRISEDVVENAPELVVEIASSSASYDLHSKLHVYRRSGVREYVVWRVLDRAVDWFVLRDGEYHRGSAASDGLCRSALFPGLWLDVEALLRRELAAVMKAVYAGLATPEHARFVERLAAVRQGRSSASGWQ